MEAKSGPDTERQRLVRLIHVAKRDLRLDDDVYRAALQSATGKTSTTEMTVPELEKTLEAMKSKGFKVRHKTRGTRKGGQASRPVDQEAQARKIRALWLGLHRAGIVRDPNESALAAYVKRMTGVEALQWLDEHQASRVIEQLKKWGFRAARQAEDQMVSKGQRQGRGRGHE